MSEKFLRALSGIDNLKGVFLGRVIIGMVLSGYGFLIFFLNSISDQWTRISLASAFWGLGLMFILDGQATLREYFTNNSKSKITPESKHSLTSILAIFFIIGVILFFIKFYSLENPSLYPMIIFLISILLILVFHEKISHFEISKDKLLVKMKKDQEQYYDNIESKKKEWDFKIEEVKSNV
ncbi:Uncharacterised protein [uncultured archaeon]|nr:Uncharacterised protein [uncultured archaeon]